MASKGLRSLFHRKKRAAETSQPSPRATDASEPSTKYGLFLLNEQYLNDTAQAGEVKYPVDIVAIHGIDGHAYDTWTHRNGRLWLRDFLPQLLPGARIFTFGYPSEVAFTLATGKLDDFARSLLEELNCVRRSPEELLRQIIFVCHSMGGIVVKQALVTAVIDAVDYANIKDNVTGILFLGTPHRGSASIQFPMLLANIANAALTGTTRFTGKMRADLIKSLEKDSGTLKALSTNFRNSATNIKIVSFIEQKASPPLKQRVVDDVSGVMDIPNESIVPMDGCDHGDICRFSDLRSPNYQKVLSHLEKIATGPLNPSEPLSQLQKLVFTVPFTQDPKFIGRENVITEIDRKFKMQSRVALAGIGGIGKSQIAIEYCYRFRARHVKEHVFWIHASTASKIDQAYKDIARRLSIPGYNDANIDTFQLVLEWLSNDANGGWLLVLDNADDMEVFFSDKRNPSFEANEQKRSLVNYLPSSSNGLILITTRDKRAGESLANNEKAIKVDPMTSLESEALLASKIGRESVSDTIKAIELLEILAYLPLAITQAAAYISQNSITIEEYLEILQAGDSDLQDLLSENLVDLRRDFESQTSVIRTWKVSFDQIKRQKPRAAEILSLMAVLDRQGIPKTLLRRDEEPINEFTTALGTLQAFSLISAEKGGTSFEIHRLVQVSTQRWLKVQGEMAKWRKKSLGLLATTFPSDKPETWATCKILYPHAQAVIRHTFTDEQDLMLLIKLLHNVSSYESEQGWYDLAYNRELNILSIREKILGSQHLHIASSKHAIARALMKKGMYKAAEKLFQEAIELQEEVSEPNSQEILNTKDCLASLLGKQGMYKEAEDMHRHILELRVQTLGPTHEDVQESRNNLATVLGNQGKNEEAEDIYRQLLEVCEKLKGPRHPDTLRVKSNLAKRLGSQGKYEQAEGLCREVLEIREQVLGSLHPSTLRSKRSISWLLGKHGKYDEAESLCREVLGTQEQLFGFNHPDTLRSKTKLSELLEMQHKYSEAEILCCEVLKGREQVLGNTHPKTLAIKKALLKLLKKQGKEDEIL